VSEKVPVASRDKQQQSKSPRRKKRRPPVARIASESGTAPKTVGALIKAVEEAKPPPPTGVKAHFWPALRGPPGPLPRFIKFGDLKAAGIIASHCGLELLIKRHAFPRGRWFGTASRVWTVEEVEAWLAARPTERPAP
jgi:hypothetical protein